MKTLDELLALLPDNTSGAIDAADLRTIVTDLFNTSADLLARVIALETSDADPHVEAVTGHWQVHGQAGSVPGGQQVTTDSGALATATWLRFSPINQENDDLTNALTKADRIFAQQQTNASIWARYDVRGPAVVTGGYVEIPVTVTSTGGAVGGAAWQNGIFVFSIPVVP